jgi:hypothetical protein
VLVHELTDRGADEQGGVVRRELRVAVVVALVAAYALFYEMPALRLHIPAVPRLLHSSATTGHQP